jgi:hypothetical protein
MVDTFIVGFFIPQSFIQNPTYDFFSVIQDFF